MEMFFKCSVVFQKRFLPATSCPLMAEFGALPKKDGVLF